MGFKVGIWFKLKFVYYSVTLKQFSSILYILLGVLTLLQNCLGIIHNVSGAMYVG